MTEDEINSLSNYLADNLEVEADGEEAGWIAHFISAWNTRATPQIDVERLKREVGDKYGRTDYPHNNGWRYAIGWAIDHLAASGYLRAPLERIEGLEDAIEATERANKSWLDFTGNNEIPDTAKAMMQAARAYAKQQGGK